MLIGPEAAACQSKESALECLRPRAKPSHISTRDQTLSLESEITLRSRKPLWIVFYLLLVWLALSYIKSLCLCFSVCVCVCVCLHVCVCAAQCVYIQIFASMRVHFFHPELGGNILFVCSCPSTCLLWTDTAINNALIPGFSLSTFSLLLANTPAWHHALALVKSWQRVVLCFSSRLKSCSES